jgi:predicted nucleic acid-binding protein
MHGRSDHMVEDGIIAATTRAQSLAVATRNETDFKQLDVAVFNPFVARP